MYHRHYVSGNTEGMNQHTWGGFKVEGDYFESWGGGVLGAFNRDSYAGTSGDMYALAGSHSAKQHRLYIDVSHIHSFGGWSNQELYDWNGYSGNYYTGSDGESESRPSNFTYTIWKRIN